MKSGHPGVQLKPAMGDVQWELWHEERSHKPQEQYEEEIYRHVERIDLRCGQNTVWVTSGDGVATSNEVRENIRSVSETPCVGKS